MKKILVFSLLLIMTSVVAMADVTYSQDMYEKAIMGDREAMYQLSRCYMGGNGVTADYERSDYWLERAAKEGQPDAKKVIDMMGGKTALSSSKRAQLAAEEKRERERLERERRGGNTPPATGNQTFTVGGVSFTMVAVQGGTFTMGATKEQGSDAHYSEKPAHRVTLSSFYIGQTEVTQELWVAVMGENPSFYNTKPDSYHREDYGTNLKRPVENVSWDDCQKFISKLNAKTGKKFRLPTEAEWEYAARGGKLSQGYKYSGSNNIDDVAWYDDNCGDKTHEVATKCANELGLYDMSGNVIEWCQNNWYNYDGSATEDGSDRVLRGGDWLNHTQSCRVSDRYRRSADSGTWTTGLRLAL